MDKRTNQIHHYVRQATGLPLQFLCASFHLLIKKRKICSGRPVACRNLTRLVPLPVSIALILFTAHSLIWSETYTLEQCVRSALKNNVEIQKSEQQLKEAKSKIREAYGTAMPSLDLEAKYERIFEQYNPITDATGGGGDPFPNTAPFLDPNDPNFHPPLAAFVGDFSQMLNFDDIVKDYNANVSLILTQVLFAQGKVSTALKIAKSYKTMMNEKHAQLENEIALDVTNTFYNCLYFKEAVDIFGNAVQQAEKHLQQAEHFYQNGLISEMDYLGAQLNVEDLKVQKDKMQSDLLLAKNALLNKMGMPFTRDISLSGELRSSQPEYSKEQAYKTALQNRKEIKQLEEYKNIQEKLVKIEKSDFYPLVYAGGALTKLGMSNEWNKMDWYDDQRVFIGLKMNLFNGLQTKQKILQAKTKVKETEINLNHLRKSIQLQLESEWNKLDEAQKRLAIRERMVKLAEKNQKMVSKAYAIGKATQLEVEDAELKTRNAKLDYQKALLDYNLADRALKMAMGKF
jgi:OMF family outer membrane factor